MNQRTLLCTSALVSLCGLGHAQTLFEASGPDVASIQATVDAYRAAMGPLNPNQAGIQNPAGRREINWDGVPDGRSDPNRLPANFFNANSPRGAVFGGPATEFLVSADDDNPTSTPPLFASFNPDYARKFQVFSRQRLFASLGSTEMSVDFFVAGSNVPGKTRGFGVVFTDVDLARSTQVDYLDEHGSVLYSAYAQPFGNGYEEGSLSFLGVSFADAVVSSVRIKSGNVLLGGDDDYARGLDVVVMDDFFYGEVVPEPATLVALGAGLAGLLARRRRA